MVSTTKLSKIMLLILLLIMGIAAFVIGATAGKKGNTNKQAVQTRQLPKIKNSTKSLEVVKAELLDEDTLLLLLSLRNISGQEIGAYTLKLGTQFVTIHGSANTRHTTPISPGEVVTQRIGLVALRPNDDVKIVSAEVGDSYEGDEEGIITTKEVRERLKQKGENE